MSEKTKNILKISGYILCGIELILGIIFIAHLCKLDVLTAKAIILIAVIILGSVVLCAALQKFVATGIITKIISILLSVVMVVGTIYVSATNKTLDKILNTKTQIENYSLYVLADDKAADIKDIKDYKIGGYPSLTNEDMVKVLEKMNKDSEIEFKVDEYEDITKLIDDLYKKKIQAILVNSAHISILDNTDEYFGIDDKIKAVWNMSIEKEVEEPTNNIEEETKDPYDDYKDYLYSGEDVITVYISGIDTTGPANVVRNSDVNILLTVNTKTRQILMINTPRDFYVPIALKEANGAKDKLTHAGCYGVKCSIKTIENLYGVKIDNYIKINFSGFVGIVDAIGGVDVYSEYEFTVAPIKTYKVGYNHCTGIEALAFARERHSFNSGDRQRGKNQMEVIKAVISKLASTDTLLNYTDFLDELSMCIVTDMSKDTLTDLIKLQLSDMRGWDFITYSADGTGAKKKPYSLSFETYVMEPNESTVETAKGYLSKIINGEIISN